jgi:hypothetical protein
VHGFFASILDATTMVKEIIFQGERHEVYKEVLIAADWLTAQLDKSYLPQEQVELFRESLIEVLYEKIYGHWFVDCPLLGSAYRSVLYDSCRVDKVLKQAAQRAFISNVQQRLPADGFILWIDPGSVCFKKFKSPIIETLYEEPHSDEHEDFKKLTSYGLCLGSSEQVSCRNEHHRKNLRSNVDSVNHASHDAMPV